MSKTYSRIRNGGGEQATALGRSLISWLGSSDAYVKAVTIGIFNHLKVSISHRIIFKAGRNARLSPCDEKIFGYYKNNIERYEQILSLYKNNQNRWPSATAGGGEYSSNDLNVKKILEGICAILSSQVRQFDELIKNRGDNPVSVEKKEIIAKGLRLFIKEYDENVRAYYEANYRNSLIRGREFLVDDFTIESALKLFNSVASDINKFSGSRLYKAYISGLEFCLEGLNDDAKRETTFFYYELLVKEEELLGGLIKIQVSALERALEKDLADSAEKEYVFLVLTNLREGYQHLKGQVREIADSWKGVKSEEDFETKRFEQEEDFSHTLNEILQGERIFSVTAFEEHRHKWMDRKTNFVEKLRSELDFRLKKDLRPYSLGRTVYELQKAIAEQLLMAQELCRCYEDIINFFKSNMEALKLSDYSDIILGINETLEIKIEAMTENKELFNKEGQRLIEEYKKERREPNSDVLMEVVLTFLQQNRNESIGKSIAEIMGKAIEAAMQGPEAIAIKEQAYKTYENIKGIFLKLTDRFKREHLLYELSTFEEIIIYSVSRLREAEKNEPVKGSETENAVAAYVKRIDLATDRIEVILKKHNIYLIKPNPHQPFNAKEHEVLMAERNNDFQKGEIIKLMNSGYKQEDRVLLRANVIAAK